MGLERGMLGNMGLRRMLGRRWLGAERKDNSDQSKDC